MARQQLNEDLLYTHRFTSLSSHNLLDARDAYHVHLAHKPDLIATAIGLYLIRGTDADAQDATKTREAAKKRGSLSERTLENTEIQPWSVALRAGVCEGMAERRGDEEASRTCGSAVSVFIGRTNRAGVRGESQLRAGADGRHITRETGNPGTLRGLADIRGSTGTTSHGIGRMHRHGWHGIFRADKSTRSG